MRNWSLREAMIIMAQLTPLLHDNGYIPALYGSVITTGSGRDLDILLVPWRRDTSSSSALQRVAQVLSAKPVAEDYFGAMGTQAQMLQMPDGRWIDLQVREAR